MFRYLIDKSMNIGNQAWVRGINCQFGTFLVFPKLPVNSLHYSLSNMKTHKPFILVKDLSQPPSHAAFIQNCFEQTGITLNASGNGDVVPNLNSVIIGIGPKP